jgi:uncharacterized membrane protein
MQKLRRLSPKAHQREIRAALRIVWRHFNTSTKFRGYRILSGRSRVGMSVITLALAATAWLIALADRAAATLDMNIQNLDGSYIHRLDSMTFGDLIALVANILSLVTGCFVITVIAIKLRKTHKSDRYIVTGVAYSEIAVSLFSVILSMVYLGQIALR